MSYTKLLTQLSFPNRISGPILETS
ncbi:ATP synthase subunit alpha, partial [Shigella flexneri]|nr:ATP synthase subunit alpha [Shigella flexneri]